MVRVAAIFPGQGSQSVGMGKDLADRWPDAAETFSAADQALDCPLSTLCWEGPEEELRLTENTQPALLTHSLAAWRVLSRHGVEVGAVAGHSLGEYSGVVAAGGAEFEDVVRTVRLRGRFMQSAVPVGEGAMAAVIGLDDSVVSAACREESQSSGEVVLAVNFNAPGQVVIAGAGAAVDRAIALCRERGARRTVLLPVSAPFHSPLMELARIRLEPALEELALQDLNVPLYRNVDATAVRAADEVRDGLVRQVDAPVLWADSVRRLCADGFDTFVEVGAGKVLSGLVKRIARGAECHRAGTVEEIERVVELLGT